LSRRSLSLAIAAAWRSFFAGRRGSGEQRYPLQVVGESDAADPGLRASEGS
jgi:hypothetical protein